MVEVKIKTITLRLVVIWCIITSFTLSSSLTPAFAFNIGEEREIGEKLLYSVRSSFKLIDDPDITQYITRLGESVLEVAGVQYFEYHFFVIDNKEFNAFAAPSGLIFFHSGLISAMHSENELVSVLAHEIGHIVKRHLASRIEKGAYTSVASLGLALAAVAFGGAAAPALLTGALATGQSVNLHFSRQHEEEADLLAYQWMKSLQRNPGGQAKMLESMRRIARYRSDKLPQYLLTHPNPEARLHIVQALMDVDQEKIENMRETADDFDFLRFKYRILSQVKEAQTLRAYLASVLANERASNLQKSMAKYGLSQVAREEKDYDKALSLLEEVIAKYPQRNILQVDKGAIQFGAGNNSQAQQSLEAALRADPLDIYATILLAKVFNRTGRIDEGKQLFEKVMYELPEYSKVYFELGQIAATEGSRGVSDFYLGKYNLYEGKIKLANSSFKLALRDKELPEAMKKESKAMLAKIKKLRGK